MKKLFYPLFCLALACAGTQSAQAQEIASRGIEVQLFSGPCSGTPTFKDGSYGAIGGTVNKFESLLRSGAALKFAFNPQFSLRAALDVYQYSVYYYTPGSPATTVAGDLYNEKTTVSLLPEYRLWTKKFGRSTWTGYGFAGAEAAFEGKKNLSKSRFLKSGSAEVEYVNKEVAPGVNLGLSAGLGTQIFYKRFGLQCDFRYTRAAANDEIPGIAKIRYNWFSLLAGVVVKI